MNNNTQYVNINLKRDTIRYGRVGEAILSQVKSALLHGANN